MPKPQKQALETSSKLATERVIPFPKQAARPERIRPELNLEKWPIWQPSKSKNSPTRRTITREIKLDNGHRVSAQVEVGFTDRGALTTEDQKTYYALVKHWEENGRSEEQTYFSIRHLAKRLNRGWGTNVIDSLTQSLLRLRGVLFTWTNSYYDASTDDTAEVLDTFNIVSELKIIKRKRDGVVNKEIGYFRFNDFILRNLLANHTKPVLLETVLSFKSEIAQILYTYLDLILNDKFLFERRTKELFEDLGLEGKAYRNLSDRKRTLERAIKELNGAALTSGRIASATLEKTADNQDYKIVIRKGKLIALPKVNHYQDDQSEQPAIAAPAEGREAAPIDQLGPQKASNEQLHNQAKELVTYFFELFQSGKNFQIPSRAIGQAISLITQYGFEQSKYIVDYARKEAPKTGFDIQTFGGIIQYSSDAIEEYHRRRVQREQATKYKAENEARILADLERQKLEEAERAKIEAYIDQLGPEEYQALFAQVRDEAQEHNAWLSRCSDQARQSFYRRLMVKKVREQQAAGTVSGGETSNETRNLPPAIA
jgi:hypothetical protein